MCDYCNIETDYLIYVDDRTFAIRSCRNHVIKALESLESLSDNHKLIVERV